MLESLFNKAAGSQPCNFIKKRLQHRCFPVKFQNYQEHLFYRTSPVAASFVKSTTLQRERTVARSCSVKKVFLEISQNSWENARARAYFLIKLQANLQLQETLAQTFSCEVCKISKNTPSYRTRPVAASEISRHGATK